MDLKAIFVNSFRSVSARQHINQTRRNIRKELTGVLFLQHLFLPKMGCVGGKEILTEEDKEYIAQNTAATREEIDQQHENFLQKHPDGKISK